MNVSIAARERPGATAKLSLTGAAVLLATTCGITHVHPSLAADAASVLQAPAVGASAALEPRPRPAASSSAASPPAPRAREPRIRVDRVAPEPGPSDALRAAYRTLHAGDFGTAARLYEELARAEPRNVDVLLGLASLALHRGDAASARAYYLRILRIEPRHAYAQAGLLAMLGRADYSSAEARLKELLGREPSAFLYHTLGNLYAEQSLWSQAQHAYFQAYHLEPDNCDYAYNLAVGLEHVGQRALALGYYRRAVELARVRGTASFDVSRAEDRIGRLAEFSAAR